MAETIDSRGPVGVWLIGARGAVSTCVAYGLAGLVEGLLEPVGLVTEAGDLARLPLVPLEDLVLGGHDVCTRSLTDSASELVRSGVLPAGLVEAVATRASAFESEIVPGILDGPDVGLADLDPRAAELGSAPPRAQIARVKSDLASFAGDHECRRVVVVNLASTEAWSAPREEWQSLEALDSELDRNTPQPASIVYAYAAIDGGHPYVNFTPSRGSSIPALRALAEARGVPHCGSDGKTGETLLKTVLAPMFRARALKVLSWRGYNMLGNRDGEVLNETAHRHSKLINKDAALRAILDDPEANTGVGIDFVPSLADWKTAMDFVHFEGFLGTKMSLQFTWQASDSALAAPLVLDLVRLTALAADRGESGALAHLACFFKAPLGGGTHDFQAQFRKLIAYARRKP